MSKRFNFQTLPSMHSGTTEANIFIHGYSAGHNAEDKKKLADSIPAAVSCYTNIFAFWPSSHFTRVNKKSRMFIGASNRVHWGVAAVALVGDRTAHFMQIRSRSEVMGQQFFKQLNDYLGLYHPEIKTINLIGHSLGGRLVVSSLKTLAGTSGYTFAINNVLLMAAAVKVEPAEARKMRALLTGRMINAYSKSDWTLLMNLDEACLGRNEVEYFENIHIAEFGHSDYWKKLTEVLSQTKFKSTLNSAQLQENVAVATDQAVLPEYLRDDPIMTLELNTPSDIYQTINAELSKVLSLLAMQPKDETLKQAQHEAHVMLKQQQFELRNQLAELKRNAEWNTFTIAFYGETGAGKSTIIETLRILLNEPKKLASRKKFRELQNLCAVNEEDVQQMQQTIEQTEARLADLAQQLSATHTQHKQLQSNVLSAINQADTHLGELAQQIRETQQRHEKQHNDALQAIAELQSLISERKKVASLWQKLLSLFSKIPEEIELVNAEQRLPDIAAARNNASTRLLAEQSETEQKKLTLKQQLSDITTAQRNASAALLSQQAEAEQTRRTLINQQQANATRLTELRTELKNQADGDIIGDGRSDFTRHTQRYDLQLDGQAFALLDVPGIEGAEGLVSDQVKQAVQTAHAVFYVTNSAAPPQTGDNQRKGTLEKIKEHLGAQTEVWTVFNKKITNTAALNRPALTNDGEQAGLVELDRKMQEQLGTHYREVFPLTALPAFLGSTDHFIGDSLNANRRIKMTKDFSPEELLEKSRLYAFMQLLSSQLLNGSQSKITRANFNKASSALKQTTDTLNTVQTGFTELSSQLKLEGQSAQTQLVSSFAALKIRLEATGQQQIDEFSSIVRNKLYAKIETDISNDYFKDTLKDCIPIEQEHLSARLPSVLGKELERFQSDAEDILKRFEEQSQELAEIYAKLGNMRVAGDFDIKINIDNGIKTGGLIGGLIGLALAPFTGGASLVVLIPAVITVLLSTYKAIGSYFSSDYKKAQQRKAVEDNLKNVTEQLRTALQDGFTDALPKMQEKIDQLEHTLEAPGKQTAAITQLLGHSIDQLKAISKQIDRAGQLS